MNIINFPPVQHIEIRDGQARIVGRTLKVKMVISRLLHGTGASIEEVMEQYNLSRAQVHAVLAYYHDHQVEIDAFFEAEDRQVEANIPSLNTLKERAKSP
jgi:uncharacterized protein (DUF433 family)